MGAATTRRPDDDPAFLAWARGDGGWQPVHSAHVNSFIHSYTGIDATARRFRTWAGTVLAALALGEVALFETATEAKRNLKAAIASVAARLGNTPTICRKCYIHPEVVVAYLAGELAMEIAAEEGSEANAEIARLRPEEAALLTLLRGRLKP